MTGTFGAEMRRRRTERGLSQAGLAELVRYDRALISRVENGRERPSRRFAAAVDDGLGADGALYALTAPPSGALDPDGDERLMLAARRPSRLDATVVESLARMLAEQRRLEDTVGSALMVKPVGAHLQVVEALLVEARGPLRPDLARVGAQWAQFRGWLATSTGQPKTAAAMYGRALEWATEARDPNMVATAVNLKGHLAWMAGAVGAMIGLSAAAGGLPGASPGVLALAVQQEARGHALAGDGAECDRCLDAAAELADRATAHPDGEPPWIYFFDPTYLGLQRGLAYRYLGRTARAVEAITNSLDGLPAEIRRSEWVGRYVVHLAAAHAQARDTGSARAALDEARGIAAGTGSTRLAGQVERLSRHLDRRGARQT